MGWKPYVVNEKIRITEFYTFFKQRCTGDYEFLGETHDFWELFYVDKGAVCVSADDKVYNLKEGDLIFHKPMELHKFHVTGDGVTEYVVVSYSCDGELSEFFKDKVFSLDYNQKSIFSELMEYAEGCCEREGGSVENYLGSLIGSGESLQKVCLYLYWLFFSLSEKGSVLSVLKTADSVVFAGTVNYMTEHICESPSVDELAKNASISISGLKRIFARYAGMGVHKYFIKLKLKTAAELLSEGYSVTYVADYLGFSSQGYLSNVFKRETGMLPSDIARKSRL